MLYIIIDPILIYLPDISRVSPQEIDIFVGDLRAWSSFILEYKNIQFRISEECRNALSNTPGYPLGQTNLAELLKHSGKYKGMADVVLKVVMPFFNNIFNDPFIDAEIQTFKTDIKDWRIDAPSHVEPNPDIYILRLPTPELRDAYKMTLGNLVCTRQEKNITTFDPMSVYVASPLPNDFPASSDPVYEQKTSSKITVKVKVVFTLIEGEKISDELREISDELSIVHSPEAVQIPEEEIELETVLDALRLAVKKYPETLISFPLTERTAKESNYEEPLDIYKHLVGLVEVWLPVFKAKGGEEAGRIYYEHFRSRCKLDESDTSYNKYPSDYKVRYTEENIFCGRHITIGTGPNCARINFQIYEDKILVARAGKHGRNKRRNS